MTQINALRARSLAASSLLLGAAVVAALSMAVTHTQTMTGRDYTPITVVSAPPAPTPTPPAPQPLPSPTAPVSGPYVAAPVLAPAPTTTGELPILGFAPPEAGPVAIASPTWLRRPRDLARYYPPRALARGVEGRVVLDCVVHATGALSCRVSSESPANWGFGEAAQRISREHQMVPARRDGVAVEGRYTMVVPFEID
ncbi:MAG: energy transducer TonB [Hyphomonadaceae bacterium]|nr:energy transducer TonB [Hyphomonadaceae bacterium]